MKSYINSSNQNQNPDSHTELARKLSAIAHPARLRLLELLSGQEKSVTELCEQLGKSQPFVSQHLKMLRVHGLIQYRRSGQRTFYRAPESMLLWLTTSRSLFLDEEESGADALEGDF
ncbi:MAG: winged helix-turn-helix transcriptional regulator [Cyanobacteria bacterium HKST-UBA01]|nr:winged helix-turn-helix transcriptional regulator [Cyanobacteria bacterium HKST-UBA01]